MAREYRRNSRQVAKRIRREQIIRTQMIIFAFITAALVFGTAFLIFGIHSDASTKDNEQEYKYYTSVTVEYGEDFDDVIDRYYDADHYQSRSKYAEEICNINNYYSYASVQQNLRPGDHLIIVYYSNEFVGGTV